MRLEIELNEKLKEGMELGFKSGKEIQQKQDILKTYITIKRIYQR